MTPSSHILDGLEKAVLEQNPDRVEEIFQDEAVSDVDYDVLLGSLTKGLDQARVKLADMSFSVGDFLMSVDAVRCGLTHLKERMPQENKKKKRAITGVATGEVHNLDPSFF